MALNSYLTLRAPINIRHSASMVSWVLRNRMTKSSGRFGQMYELGLIGVPFEQTVLPISSGDDGGRYAELDDNGS